MVQKIMKITGKLTLVLIVILINFLLKQEAMIDSNIASANIDGGFILLLLMGLSYGGYKLYIKENNQ